MEMHGSNFSTRFCVSGAFNLLLEEAEKGSNFVFSPLSFHSMLGIVAVGSRGKTAEKLLSFLGLTSIDNLKSLAAYVVTSLLLPAENENNKLTGVSPVISFVNGAWIDHRFSLKPSFQEVLKATYNAIAKEVDFVNKADQVQDEVNLWVERSSNGLIRNLLPPDSAEADTALILANAVYFKGVWNRKFDASKTEDKYFHLPNGRKVKVPFMTSKKYEKHLYGSFHDYEVVKIPYQNTQDNRQFSMYFFLPNAKDGLQNLVEKFRTDPVILNDRFELKEEEIPDFWIPRFKFSFEFEASNAVKEMGLEMLFQEAGELTEMVDSPQSLVVSKLFHKSFIEVNEDGTEAAASTAPRILKQSRRLNPPSFVADHPFIFIIKEENSGIMLFIGAVINPFLVS